MSGGQQTSVFAADAPLSRALSTPQQVPVSVADVSDAADTADLRQVLQAVVEGRAAGAPPTDWARTLALARLHQLDAFLFDAVAAWPAECRPDAAILSEWARLQRSRIVAAIRMREQRAVFLAALNAAGVPAIPLKGAWLAEAVYPDLIQRPMSDMDLLIRPEQLDTAQAVMTALGYAAVMENQPGGWGKERLFRHPEWRCGVEIQWTLWHPSHKLTPGQDLARLWDSAEAGRLSGVDVPLLPPAAHLVYLAYHLQAHQWRFPARAHLDLVLLGRRFATALSAETLEAEARAWGLGFRAPFVWRVAHDLCGVEPPAALAAWTRPLEAFGEERRAALAVALPGAVPGVAMSRLLSEFLQASWRRRASVGLRAVLAPPAKIRQAYPAATRWCGLAGGYAARAVDLVQRRWRDAVPDDHRRATVNQAAEDMSACLRLGHWLASQEQL